MPSFYLMSVINADRWTGDRGPYTASSDITVTVMDRACRMFRFRIRKGFRCDGLSVPWAFRWFLPSWDEKNHVYNLAGAVHDGLYTFRGCGLFGREECDDIFRSILRDSGISRFKAGMADKAVEWFAGGKNHWGNDNYGNAGLFSAALVSL